MKYSASNYAKAFVAALAAAKGKNEEEIGKNFLALVRKNGDEAHLKKIIAEAERFLRERDGTRKLVVESARPLGRKAEEILKNIARPGDVFEEKLNPELIAGVKITVNDELQFDGSLKMKIDKMFTNI